MNLAKRFFRSLGAALRDSISLWWIMPVIPLIATGGELLQHYVEAQLGMFHSLEAFELLQFSRERLQAGGVKVATILLSWLYAARYLASAVNGAEKRWKWWSLNKINWRRQLIALGIGFVGVFALVGIADFLFGPVASAIVAVILMIATLPLIPYVYGALIGDDTMTLRQAFTSMWPAAIAAMIALALTYGPLQYLHVVSQFWALGQNSAPLWAILIWDSALVGTMGVLMGAINHRFYWKPD